MMKRSIQKTVSILISVIMIITSLVALCGIPAGATTASEQSNLLNGLIPITYTGATQGTTSYNWQPVRIDDNNSTKWGYDTILVPNEGVAGMESWVPYLTKLTDGIAETTQWVQPGRISNPYDNFVIAYELNELVNLDGFSFNTSSTASKTVAVYAANTKADLFKNKVAELSTEDANVTATISTVASKYVAFVLKTPGYYVSEIEVYGKELTNNVIAGKYASAYAPTARTSSTIWYKWGMIRVEDNDTNKMWGWDLLQPDHTAAFNDTNKAHIAKLTDNKADTAILLKPENCWDKTTDAGYDNMYIVYELDRPTNLDSFSFNTTSTNSKTVEVYAASNYADLYSSKVAKITATTNTKVEGHISTFATKYVAFVLETPGYYVSEIEVYGKATTSVIEGEIPIVYTSTADGGNSYNWETTRIDAAGTLKGGYSMPMKQNILAYGSWKQYLTKLTDNNFATAQWVQPANSPRDFAIVYETNGSADISGFIVDTASTASKNIKVYAAATYADLFSNNIADITTSNKTVAQALATPTTDSRYVGFLFDGPAYDVNEIQVCGDMDYVSNDINFTKSNVIKGDMPVVFSSAYSGQTDYNWNSVYLSNDHNVGSKLGYSMNINENVSDIELWKQYLTKFTDEDNTTSFWIEPVDATHDYVIVYQFENEVQLEGFRLDTQGNNINGKVYASANYSDLFTDAKKIATLQSRDYLNCFSGTASGSVKYVALLFTTPAFCITEFEVFGYTTPSDVTFTKPNILGGKIPVTYTSAYQGETSYNWRKVRTVKTVKDASTEIIGGYDALITPTQGLSGKANWEPFLSKFTDGNASTVQWVQPEWNFDGTNYDDMVIVYEFENAMNLEGFSFNTYNSKSKTIKVYAANTSAELFNNNVATITTDNYIVKDNISTVATKYIAFVLTTPAVYVSEIEVYGEETVFSVGDTNCDGAINATDMAYLRDIVLENVQTIEKRTADINVDTYVNIRDLVALRAKLISAN